MSKPKFEGWASQDANGELKYEPFEPKTWDEDDVDVKVLYCGVCGSDTALLDGEWGKMPTGAVCGHEIVGEVVKVGSKVENGLKPGMLVGIGMQSDSCRECEQCLEHEENHCALQTTTVPSPTRLPYQRGNAKGDVQKGGFAKYWRGPSHFVVPLPDGLEPAAAAPLLCGGVTVFSPLQNYGAGTRAKNVGVIGVGGLGHMAIMIAKAMGATVTAISRGEAKKDDALKLGVSHYIATGNDLAADFKDHHRSLDLIICTINPPTLTPNEYFPLLKPKGTLVLVGIVPKPFKISSFELISNTIGIAGSLIGSPKEIAELFDLAAKHNLGPWIQKFSMDDINHVLADFRAGKPKYRFVLVNTDNGGKL